MKAIETRYKGYRFRSRLEARWAVFFNALKLPWEYEPEGFEFNDGTRYLPDFRVRYPGRDERERHYVWFEVKPNTELTEEEMHKMKLFAMDRGQIILLDGPPSCGMYIAIDDYPDPLIDLSNSPPPERRDGYALWCGKGRLWWDNAQDFWGCEGMAAYDQSINKLRRAVTIARSARFEHGECPA